VTVQLSLCPKSLSGSSVNVVGPPLTVALWAPLVAQLTVYQPDATSTGSLNVTVTSAFTATSVAALPGECDETVGAASPVQKLSGDEVFRGVGVAAAKLSALTSVSVQPPPRRIAAVVFVSAGAGSPSKKFAPS
jgi:hypothetical protein